MTSQAPIPRSSHEVAPPLQQQQHGSSHGGGFVANVKRRLFSRGRRRTSVDDDEGVSDYDTDPRSGAEDEDDGEGEDVFSDPSDALDMEGEGYFSDGTGVTSNTSDAGPHSPGSTSSRGGLGAHRIPMLGLQGMAGDMTGGFNPANLRIDKQSQQQHQLQPLSEEQDGEAQERPPFLAEHQHRNSTIKGRAGFAHPDPSNLTPGSPPSNNAFLHTPSVSSGTLAPSRPSTIVAANASPLLSQHASPLLASQTLPAANELPTDPELAESLTRGLFVTAPLLLDSAGTGSGAASSCAGSPRPGGSPSVSPQLAARRMTGRHSVSRSPGPGGSSPRATSPARSIHMHHAQHSTSFAPPHQQHQQYQAVPASSSSAVSAAYSQAHSPRRASAALFNAPSSPSPAPQQLLANAPTTPTPATDNSGPVQAAAPSIFERDIEHRSASHLLTKTEAMDVAIPSVLTDAVEALNEYDPQELEIVEPQAAAAPLALSAHALSSHTHTADVADLPGSAISSVGALPAGGVSPSPPLSYVSHDEPPVGSLAAQIAEKLAPRTRTAPHDVHNSGLSSPTRALSGAEAAGAGGGSSSAASIASGNRSPVQRKTANRGSFGAGGASSPRFALLQPQVGEASSNGLNFQAPGSPSHSMHATLSGSRLAASAPITPGSVGFGPGTSSPLVSHSPLPTAVAFPSLPLPNPYRASSPPPDPTEPRDGEAPAQTSISVDGAVISGAESATAQASLDGLADVIAANVPIGFPAGSTEEAAPYSTRPSPVLPRRQSEAEGGLPTLKNATSSPMKVSSSGTFGTPSKRLSFFSAADMINSAKGEVHTFEEAIMTSATSDSHQHGLGLGLGPSAATSASGSSSASMSRSASGSGMPPATLRGVPSAYQSISSALSQ